MIIEKKKKKKGKKGQIGFGAILIAFIGILVGITLFTVVAQTIGTSTSTITLSNTSMSTNAVNGTPYYLTGYSALSSVVIYNETADALVSSADYTVTNHVVYNGAEVVTITPDTSADLKYKWKVSGVAEPTGYVGGAGRSIALLIPIFFALVIAVIALEPTLRSNILEAFGR
jgi:hypothetical protein